MVCALLRVKGYIILGFVQVRVNGKEHLAPKLYGWNCSFYDSSVSKCKE